MATKFVNPLLAVRSDTDLGSDSDGDMSPPAALIGASKLQARSSDASAAGTAETAVSTDKALGCLAADNPFRLLMGTIVTSTLCSSIIMILVILNTIMLGIQAPRNSMSESVSPAL